MSVEKVREYLDRFGVAERVQEFSVSSATVELAAQALGVIPARIAKTLSLKSDDGCMLIVAAGDVKIDNQKFKQRFHHKARMLSHDDALAYTGHAVGGVCPFALPEGVTVFLDESLKRFDTVFPACGSSSSAIELSCDELLRCSCAEGWVDVCAVREPV